MPKCKSTRKQNTSKSADTHGSLIERIITFRQEHECFLDVSFNGHLEPVVGKVLRASLLNITATELDRAITLAQPHKQRIERRNDLESRIERARRLIATYGIKLSDRDMRWLNQTTRVHCTDELLDERTLLVERAELAIAYFEHSSFCVTDRADFTEEVAHLKRFQDEVYNLARQFIVGQSLSGFTLNPAHQQVLTQEITADLDLAQLRKHLERIRTLCFNRMVDNRRRQLTADGIPNIDRAEHLTKDPGTNAHPKDMADLSRILDEVERIQTRNSDLEQRRLRALKLECITALNDDELSILNQRVGINDIDEHSDLRLLLDVIADIEELEIVLQPA